jgi:hypothetical protein
MSTNLYPEQTQKPNPIEEMYPLLGSEYNSYYLRPITRTEDKCYIWSHGSITDEEKVGNLPEECEPAMFRKSFLNRVDSNFEQVLKRIKTQEEKLERLEQLDASSSRMNYDTKKDTLTFNAKTYDFKFDDHNNIIFKDGDIFKGSSPMTYVPEVTAQEARRSHNRR